MKKWPVGGRSALKDMKAAAAVCVCETSGACVWHIWDCNQWASFKSCQSKQANKESTLQTIDLRSPQPTQTRTHTITHSPPSSLHIQRSGSTLPHKVEELKEQRVKAEIQLRSQPLSNDKIQERTATFACYPARYGWSCCSASSVAKPHTHRGTNR